MSYHVGELKHHKYVYVDTTFTHKEPQGFIPAVWFGLVAYPSRAWGCTVMFESGAIYRALPIHALALTRDPRKTWTAQDAQTWDCYGYEFVAHEYAYLAGLDCLVKANGKEHHGQYMFSVAPIDDSFSLYPEQAKEFTFVALENGRITAQPTNHTVFCERSFTNSEMEFPYGLKRMTEIYSAE